MELWKDVIGYEEYYQISTLGRIRNKIENRILKPSKSGGYYHISLRYGKKKECLIHRLVAEAFIDNPFNFRCVNHKDENKLNNNVDNLEWCTVRYNSSYGKCELMRNQRVIQYDLSGNALKIWESIKEASETLNISREGISACCRNKRKTAGGYAWTYANIQTIRMKWKNKNKLN